MNVKATPTTDVKRINSVSISVCGSISDRTFDLFSFHLTLAVLSFLSGEQLYKQRNNPYFKQLPDREAPSCISNLLNK